MNWRNLYQWLLVDKSARPVSFAPSTVWDKLRADGWEVTGCRHRGIRKPGVAYFEWVEPWLSLNQDSVRCLNEHDISEAMSLLEQRRAIQKQIWHIEGNTHAFSLYRCVWSNFMRYTLSRPTLNRCFLAYDERGNESVVEVVSLPSVIETVSVWDNVALRSLFGYAPETLRFALGVDLHVIAALKQQKAKLVLPA